MNVNFNFPDFLNGYALYKNHIIFRDKFPQVFNEGYRITSVYGNLPNCIWNGGTVYVGGYTYRYEFLKKLVEIYNSAGIPLRLTFTNPLLEEHHVYDSYANMIARAFHNGFNEIVITSPLLEEYIRAEYPNFRFVKSILGTYMEDQDVFLEDRYSMSCMKRIQNNNWEYLDTIPMELRPKVEFLCNDPCPDLCPRLKTHYMHHAQAQLSFEYNVGQECSFLPLRMPFPLKTCSQNKTFISKEMIEELYLPRGFNNFKIAGRFVSSSFIISYVNYMIKPEYRDDVLYSVLESYRTMSPSLPLVL